MAERKWDTQHLSLTRPDAVTAAVIDRAIAMVSSHGLDASNRYLSDHGIDLLTTLRVLGNPIRRRSAR